jgi:hypothetical protein
MHSFISSACIHLTEGRLRDREKFCGFRVFSGGQRVLTNDQGGGGEGMKITIHPHARKRMVQRGAADKEVEDTILLGEKFEAKFGRKGFRHNFSFESNWGGKYYLVKQLEVFAVFENDGYTVITIITKYF